MRFHFTIGLSIILASCVVGENGSDQAPPSGAEQNVDNSTRAEAASPSIAAASSYSWTRCSCGQALGSFAGQTAYCDGDGDVTCAGAGTYGWRYQCVELVNRFLQVVKHKPHIYANAGQEFCDVARQSSAYTSWGPKYSNNRGHKPGAGDILVWNSDYGNGTGYPGHDAGHVAVVTGSDATHLYYLQQNWGWYETGWGQVAASSTAWNGASSWFGAPGADINSTFHSPICWVHPE